MPSDYNFSLDDIMVALLAEGVKFRTLGKPSSSLYKLMSVMSVKPGGIFYAQGKLAHSIQFTDSVILTNEEMMPPAGCVVLRVDKPQLAFYRLMNRLLGARLATKPGIHPTSVVGVDTKIHPSASIGPFCHLEDCEIGENVVLKSHVTVFSGSVIEDNVTIDAHSVIGAQGVAWAWDFDRDERVVQPQIGFLRIGKGTFLGAGTIIVRGSINETTTVGQNCVFAPGNRLGHGCIIGNDCHFANNIAVGGNTNIGNSCFLGVSCSIRPQVKLADRTLVAAGAVVVKNCVKEGRLLMGVPAVEYEQGEKSFSGVPRS